MYKVETIRALTDLEVQDYLNETAEQGYKLVSITVIGKNVRTAYQCVWYSDI